MKGLSLFISAYMKYSIVLLLILLFSTAGCSQTDVYNLSNYKEVKRGIIELDGVPIENIILLQHKSDSNYTAKETYEDSLYQEVRVRMFYYKNVLNGPIESFVDGRLFQKGFYKMGKRDGERITYGKQFITSKHYYSNGIRVGTWEEFNDKGKLISKTVYDKNSNIVERWSLESPTP